MDVRGISSLTGVSMWLAMDLDVKLKDNVFQRIYSISQSIQLTLIREMNQKTLFMYYQQFQIDKFPLIFKELPIRVLN